jgi:HAD superfamily hydrolase (TIGR01549 family)
MTKPYLIFDAGGTIVFPDFTYLVKVANKKDIRVSKDELFNIHCDLIYNLDVQTRQNGHLADPFPNGYPHTLFKGLVTDNYQINSIVNIIEERSLQKSLWTASYPWVKESLDLLKSSGFSMSVVSNSDGRVAQILKDLDLISYFDQVFDSDIIGYSKPDSRLFDTALNALNLEADETIYIGDVYYIDVWGANQAGLGAIHLDPRGLYKDWQGVHIRSVEDLPDLISLYLENPGRFDLFPANDITISY